jgi:hypothetical protein
MSNGYATPSAAIAALNLTPAQEREELEGFIWDFYKYVNGVRPRWMDFGAMTLEELRRDADYYGAQYVAQEREEREAREARAKERVRACNARALAKRRFNKAFNSLALAFPS